MLIPIVPTFARTYAVASNITLNTDSAVIGANFTYVQKYLAASLTATGTYVKLRVRGPVSGSTVISACYVGLSATTGNAWNFAASPTAVTWDNGQANRTLTAGEILDSDGVAFSIPGGQSISIAFNLTSGSVTKYRTGIGSNYIRYSKSGVSEASTVSKGSGYSIASGQVDIITQILAA